MYRVDPMAASGPGKNASQTPTGPGVTSSADVKFSERVEERINNINFLPCP